MCSVLQGVKRREYTTLCSPTFIAKNSWKAPVKMWLNNGLEACCPWVGDSKDNTWSIRQEKEMAMKGLSRQEWISRRLCLCRTWVHLKEIVWKPFSTMHDRKRKEIAPGTDFQPGNSKIYTSWESALIKGNISVWKKMKHKLFNLRQGSFNRILIGEATNYWDYQTSGGTEGSPRGQQAGTPSSLNDCTESPHCLQLTGKSWELYETAWSEILPLWILNI